MIAATTYSDRPELWAQIEDLGSEVWPEYNMHGDVMNLYWGRLYDTFPDFQFVLYDDESDEVLAEAHTMPCIWDGTDEGLPHGIDDAIVLGFEGADEGSPPNTLCAMAAEVPPRNRDRRLSPEILRVMAVLARDHDFDHLIAPLRPNWKERYPLTPIHRYAAWTRSDGLPFDPWLRSHVRLGGRVLKAVEDSLLITGTVAEWESWTDMAFPESGSYVFPQGLATVAIDREKDRGVYWEPNIWVRHAPAPSS